MRGVDRGWARGALDNLGWDVNVTRDETEAASGVCPGGAYCPRGTVVPIGCPARSYCAVGADQATPCPSRLTSESGAEVCSLRVVSVDISRISIEQVQGLGLLSPSFAHVRGLDLISFAETTALDQGGCPAGTYCPRGAAMPIGCPARSYCVALSGVPVGCPAGILSAAGASSASGCNTRWVNVTLTGVERGRAWGRWLPANWGSSVSWDTTVPTVRICPAGRFCPSGAVSPTACETGAYSGTIGERSASKCVPCEAGYYCPDPGQRYPCPLHTVSAGGSASQLACKCKKGLVCLYARQLQVSVFLPLSLGQWLSDPGLRASMVQAVAASAQVDKGSVWISKATPQAVEAGGGRRLLASASPRRTAEVGTLVRLAVHNGEAFHRLEGWLGEAHPRLRNARVQWTPGSRVRVLGGIAFSKGNSYI